MKIYESSHYRQFIKHFIDHGPVKGRGALSKIAAKLNVHSTLVSLILSGKRELTMEQACEFIDFMDLTEDEGNYFLLLVERERAGTIKLKKRIQNQLDKIKSEQSSVGTKLPSKKVLSEKDQAQFYSHWLYSGIRLFCTTSEKGKTVEEIVDYFKVSRVKAVNTLNFLTQVGLVVQEKGRYKMGEQRTYIGPGSPFLLKHHTNWRLKSLQKMPDISSEELMVTSPFSVSRKDFVRIKELLLDFIAESSKVIQKTDPVDLACFNLDLFWLEPQKKEIGS